MGRVVCWLICLPAWCSSCCKSILKNLWLMYVACRCSQQGFWGRDLFIWTLNNRAIGEQATGKKKNGNVFWASPPQIHVGTSLCSTGISRRDLFTWLWVCCPWTLFEYTPSQSCFAFHQGVFCLKGIAATAKWSVSLPLLSLVDITFHYPDEPERILLVVLICPQVSLCHVRKKPVTFSSLPHPSQFQNLE